MREAHDELAQIKVQACLREALKDTVVKFGDERDALKAKLWKSILHTCPKCGHEGPVDPDFGVKMVHGVERKQSWCRECRRTTSYYRRKCAECHCEPCDC